MPSTGKCNGRSDYGILKTNIYKTYLKLLTRLSGVRISADVGLPQVETNIRGVSGADGSIRIPAPLQSYMGGLV
jgi:hypothetical protein